jgi:4-amino-4-deoxy-L-arabinose transferase-like glycosyltransferase
MTWNIFQKDGDISIEENGEWKRREQAKDPNARFVFPWIFFALFISAAYVPFLGLRYSRTAGDDKVYVAQALEMQRDGRFFIQTLADVPDYRKGPFHYLALRLGMATFGRSMWATVYMNWILVVAGAIAVAFLAGRHLGGSSGWAYLAGTAFALNAGIYSHVFASQMEVELAAVFALALLALDRAPEHGKSDWIFWLLVALAGTIKAPLHSIFLGFTAILFWAATGALVSRARNVYAWLGLGLGILFGIIAYLPPLIFDAQNFFATFFGRENFEKGSNGASWHYPIIPIFTYSLFPWTFIALVVYADGIRRLWLRAIEWKAEKRIRINLDSGHERLVVLAFSLMIPSIIFFLFHGYRGQNYHLPLISGLVLWIVAIWATACESWKKAYVVALSLTASILLVVPVLLTYIVVHFRPMPEWWWEWTLPSIWLGFVLSAKGIFEECFRFHLTRPQALARRTIWVFIALSIFLVNLGEREMIDLRAHYKAQVREGKSPKYAFYNLHENVWSEWGYLNFWADVPVTGAHTENGLKEAIERGDIILIPGEDLYAKFSEFREKNFPNHRVKIDYWLRWQTKGKNHMGESSWHEAWRLRQLSKIEKKFFIVELKAPNAG